MRLIVCRLIHFVTFVFVVFSLQNAVETIYIAEVLLCCSTESCRDAPRSPPHPPPPGDKGEMQVVPIIINHLTKLSSVRIYLPKDIRSSDAKHSVCKAIGEVQKRFPDGLPLLDPIKVHVPYFLE